MMYFYRKEKADLALAISVCKMLKHRHQQSINIGVGTKDR